MKNWISKIWDKYSIPILILVVILMIVVYVLIFKEMPILL